MLQPRIPINREQVRESVAALEKIRQPFNINLLTQTAASSVQVICEAKYDDRLQIFRRSFLIYRAVFSSFFQVTAFLDLAQQSR
jgi:hypothetical protein